MHVYIHKYNVSMYIKVSNVSASIYIYMYICIYISLKELMNKAKIPVD